MSGRLRKADWEVRAVPLSVARAIVEREHYSKGASNTATYLHGLFPKGALFDEQCVGVAWWIPPTRAAALATYPANCNGVLALSRMAINSEVPNNACSFLLSRSARLVDRNRWPCLVTYADEWRGHTGAIYRAVGWEYCGKTKPERTYVLGGRMIARKAGPKTRTHSEMLAIGAEMVGAFAKHKFRHIAANDNNTAASQEAAA